ncbi:MAG: hypothetical protein DMD87_09240 [Candidatus Rokuibacteriota bacterium]|nr:MAG: hypothetical protein DMD87_09240 [Candidatus Rokubacteria bacterium]
MRRLPLGSSERLHHGLARALALRARTAGLVFAAVGILHMIGDAALQRLLAERGFKIERVPLGAR